ncbi:hypothetical protein [Actinomadura alba]|uniref:Uncharacterized protein n=1 Tax=Actinomadura alba TaxID=406431 RepID=A0ABR7M1U7_9ACTN|nr:hypothetical protein [Actinomadura alba]MBC6471011.1 hypothetical protein [Actinomadura alba]
MTSPEHYDYCGLYLRGLSEDAAVELAAHATGAPRDGSLLHIDGIDIEILRNPDFTHDAADFPTWPVKIEIEKGHATTRQVVAAVSEILTSAWQAGYDAVAACDYEDELPEQGGYPRYRN